MIPTEKCLFMPCICVSNNPSKGRSRMICKQDQSIVCLGHLNAFGMGAFAESVPVLRVPNEVQYLHKPHVGFFAKLLLLLMLTISHAKQLGLH